jgi:hypothetical protein
LIRMLMVVMDERRASSMRMTAYQSLGAESTTEVGKDDPSRRRAIVRLQAFRHTSVILTCRW